MLSVIPDSEEDQAVATANGGDHGLGGSVWTRDGERGEAVACRVATGTIGINACANDPTAPFGELGVNGIGRELGPEGLHSYQNVEDVHLDPSS
ncbi:hypothetical protein GCM10010472_21960 [Pseudonocardia halophobica]|uniref:Aldehyde dehydrogenase domain-containing protein n=1 Tax=Pseudonocardia halophobica TaxID=29401 RepID=A0A9W6KXC1_9PSEU|nr:aldehyde dehydrogenase family protein [Pseudonocardia halophobica]GLL09428.1 hypothetical protein GCM10017577_05680 [Pseudonocardia halophobica]